jgi:hypothetical protein
MGMVAWILAMTCQSPTLEEIAEGIITTEGAAFMVAVADFAASHYSESKRNRLHVASKALKHAIVKALTECRDATEHDWKGKTG